MNEAKVRGSEDLVRDLRTGAILTSNPKEFEAYRVRKAKKVAEKRREREISQLKNDVADLKSLMVEVLDKLTKL